MKKKERRGKKASKPKFTRQNRQSVLLLYNRYQKNESEICALVNLPLMTVRYIIWLDRPPHEKKPFKLPECNKWDFLNDNIDLDKK